MSIGVALSLQTPRHCPHKNDLQVVWYIHVRELFSYSEYLKVSIPESGIHFFNVEINKWHLDSAANDPPPQMISRPQMILERKRSPTWTANDPVKFADHRHSKNWPVIVTPQKWLRPGSDAKLFMSRTWINYMKSSASGSMRNACFNLERLRRSFRLAWPRISPLERLWNGFDSDVLCTEPNAEIIIITYFVSSFFVSIFRLLKLVQLQLRSASQSI